MSSRKVTSSLDTAAILPGEYGFISSVVSDPLDDTTKLVYADWLEERGDSRGAFLRELVAATRSLKRGSSLPDSENMPRAWANMLGVPLLQGIVELDLVEIKDTILRLARPAATIETNPVEEARVGVGSSKFGGRPDLPRDTPWPACERGRLGFLGQVALGDLQTMQVASSLPRVGLLSFFAYQSYVTGYQPGVVEEVAGDTRVLYTPESAELVRREPPDDLDEEGNAILPTCRLAFCETWDLPNRGDKLPRAFAADMKKLCAGDRGELLYELRTRCHSFGHHLLGYSIHGRCPSDPSPGVNWLHLLCLDSDHNLGWSWCDGMHLAVFVHQKDVQSGSFERTYGYAS